jgi:hypothetical protein
MRTVLAAALLAVVVLAGCSGLSAPDAGNATDTPLDGTDTTTASDGASETTVTDGTDATTTAASGEPAAGGLGEGPPDPPTDRLGWEAGYWHNESIAVDNSDGMNASERRAAVARAMARVEYVRQLEFEVDGTIPISVRSREEFRNRTFDGATNHSAAVRTFENGKFEAPFLVGEDEDALATQRTNRAATTGGYYDLRNDSIVLISDTGRPQFDGEETLAQEVGHALQDTRFNVTAMRRSVETRDALNGQNGLVEGDGNLIDERYMERCGDEWECIPQPDDSDALGGGGGAGDVHIGINMMRYFPYSDGPTFIEYHYDRGGWDRIDAMYEDPPVSAEQIIYPEAYPDERPTNVTLRDATSADWERVRPDERPAGATLGQSVITTMFAYTWFDADYRRRGVGVVSREDFLHIENGQVDTEGDLFDYDIPYSDGWDGDTLHVYARTGANDTNGASAGATTADDETAPDDAPETAYVWRIEWESRSEATEFVEGYGSLLQYWGGERVPDRDGVWRIDDEASPFTDAYAVRQSGTTVTLVNAPTVGALPDVSDTVAAPAASASG